MNMKPQREENCEGGDARAAGLVFGRDERSGKSMGGSSQLGTAFTASDLDSSWPQMHPMRTMALLLSIAGAGVWRGGVWRWLMWPRRWRGFGVSMCASDHVTMNTTSPKTTAAHTEEMLRIDMIATRDARQRRTKACLRRHRPRRASIRSTRRAHSSCSPCSTNLQVDRPAAGVPIVPVFRGLPPQDDPRAVGRAPDPEKAAAVKAAFGERSTPTTVSTTR